jgi:uncharacterized OB-fold protein
MTDAAGHAMKPIPKPSPESGPYWAAAKERRLSLQACDHCGTVRCPPACLCPACGSDRATWRDMSGRGVIHSFVVVHRATHAGFDQVPYAVGVIALAEGPRLVTNVATPALETLRCGLPVQVYFEERGDGVLVPQFRVVAGGQS